MIFLEQTVNQILLEEGQVIVTLDDLQITWEDLERLFIGIYEQAKQYISIYDWTTDSMSLIPSERDYAHIRHLTYNAYFQRIMPDVPGEYYEYNPYTKNASSMINTTFQAEVAKYPTLERLDYSIPLNLVAERKQIFVLPCAFYPEDFSFADFEAFEDRKNPNRIIFESDNGVGQFDTRKLRGELIMDKDFKGTLRIKSKYMGIKELDNSCELFYNWFKGALFCYIGAQKKQMDLTGVGLPFNIDADGMLERGRELIAYVNNELKVKKQHWSNF